ncbi:MAG TPA: PQQ-dependent sugar dehydrogenase [Reyranella sp.]|nr:PQQ-dependent sugar dehydrogenase [Reyranella sp.]
MRRQKAVHACLVGALAAAFGCGALSVQAQDLKHYESNNKNFWLNPPADWFLGDETQAQKGLVPNPGQPLPSSQADLEKMLANVKLPPGFKIKVWAQGVPQARQMAWGDKGTLFVGTFDKGVVSAVVDGEGGKKVAKPFITGLRMPTGVAFMNHSLYVIDIDKLYKYDNPEADLSKAPEAKVVYDDMPPYVPHGWKYLVDDGKGGFYVPFGPPCNICMPPTSVSQYRRVDPADGTAEIVALGIRNSVGGAVDPRTGDLWFTENARDWMSDDMPSDKLNHVTKLGEHFGYPHCHQGDTPDPKFAMGHKCSEFTPPVVNLGPHVAPLGMKFYTGSQFPAEYKNGIFIAEHGSWNRHKKNGYRIVFISVGPDGKNPKETVFAQGGFLDGEKIVGRPADILQAPDGSLLVADDQTGAVYQISYSK